MFPIRLQKRACTDDFKINHFLIHAQTGFLGLSDGGLPYVVPLNFIWWNETVYFHGATEGRKMSILEQNAQCCFTISEEYGSMTSPVPAHTDTAYMSVMLFGSVELVTGLDEATAAMQQMLDKYVPGYYDTPLTKTHIDRHRSSLGSRTAVLKLKPTSLSAKENERKEERMYYPGKKIGDDYGIGD
ncbi:pyridoxamine 5'-phosphate oxidase family protein [Paenibacillus oenotherae]|uniref:Pyridoxamine 5'-phosphate oxidase family protein n=1 Tax=Paenibacillus oenotherae TaxID=1435645 RepID=A0ABS7D3G6_9BACL|nr:pyridoxamine 5'-phosphate oxidase family protein [Paenibacillus oenotherae]MBW7474356.1 pyridoxamine 5'-phosphate oxidase family protein [Paenibacillus oenotherae]